MRPPAVASEDQRDEESELRRGPWTLEEDNLLSHFIADHGEGRWNLLAKCAGLKRTGKSCRLRWLNYLKPDIKRGNLTPKEQLLILELQSKWGNRWSRIAQHLPGRTDNEIKNYWRTRVQKQARQLNMESHSQRFLDAVRCFWMPRLLEKVDQSTPSTQPPVSTHQGYQTPAFSSLSPPPIFGRPLPVKFEGYPAPNEGPRGAICTDSIAVSQHYGYPNAPLIPPDTVINCNSLAESPSYGSNMNSYESFVPVGYNYEAAKLATSEMAEGMNWETDDMVSQAMWNWYDICQLQGDGGVAI